MRKLFVFMVLSANGFFEGKNHELDWHLVDTEFQEFALRQLETIDILLFGRKTYDMMASYWQTDEALQEDPLTTKAMNKKEKIVLSHNPLTTEWENTKLVPHTIADTIRTRKAENGNDIAVFGSNETCVYLLEEKLIDEIRVIINPLLLSEGTPFFSGLTHRQNLTLLSSTFFQSGNILLNYTVQY